LTYRELNAKANQLAHYLRSAGSKTRGFSGNLCRAIARYGHRIISHPQAGGAYIPLDPSYPKERLAFILEDAQASVLLTQTSLVEAMPQHQAQVVC
jgi:non-ribosomal peptide synthetase component F